MKKYVLDVTFHREDSLCFCPMDDDGNVIIGLMIMGDYPPGELVGVFHEDGQDAVNEWCNTHKPILDKLFPV